MREVRSALHFSDCAAVMGITRDGLLGDLTVETIPPATSTVREYVLH